jgi:hypothetical protein
MENLCQHLTLICPGQTGVCPYTCTCSSTTLPKVDSGPAQVAAKGLSEVLKQLVLETDRGRGDGVNVGGRARARVCISESQLLVQFLRYQMKQKSLIAEEQWAGDRVRYEGEEKLQC